MKPVMRCLTILAMVIAARGWAGVAAGKSWIEIRTPNFIVVSDASAGQARRTAAKFEQFRVVMQAVLPRLKVDPGNPLIVFAARDGNSLKEILPKELQQKGMSLPSGIFQAGPENNFVVLRIDAPGDQGYHVIYHEYVHLIMRINLGNLPVWLSEGLAEFFGHATLGETQSGLGRPSDEQLAVLREAQLLPLSLLMSIDHDSPYYREREKVRLFYAQSWALTHYLEIGDNRAHSKQLAEFVDLLQKNVPEAEAVQRAFGDLVILERNLDQYIRSMAFYYVNVSTRLGIRADQYASRPLTEAEALAYRGELFVHMNRLEEARTAFGQALQLDPRSVKANEGMGLLCLRRQDRAQAQKYFGAAADLDSGSYMAQYYAARAAWEQGGKTDVASAEAYLRRAIAIRPGFVPAYAMLSSVLSGEEERRAEALDFARKAAELEPGDMSHQFRIASILLAMDRMDEAEAIGRRVVAGARDSLDRHQAESLLASISRRREYLRATRQRSETQQARLKEMEDQKSAAVIAPAQPEKTDPPIPTGPPGKLKGVIRAVKCDFPAVLDIVLEAEGKQWKLRALNYYDVRFGAVGMAGRDDFQPCTELEGKLVQVEYLTVAKQDFAGLIQSVIIEKLPISDGTAPAARTGHGYGPWAPATGREVRRANRTAG